MKLLGYNTADKEKLINYILALLVLKYRNNPNKVKEEVKEVNRVCLKNQIVYNVLISRRRDISNIVVRRTSYAKHFKSKKHLEIDKLFEIIIPEW